MGTSTDRNKPVYKGEVFRDTVAMTVAAIESGSPHVRGVLLVHVPSPLSPAGDGAN